MRSVLAGLRTLVLPWGAPANSPAIVIGPDVPAELVAAYAPQLVASAAIYRYDATHYDYDALVYTSGTGVWFRALGRVTPGPVVTERVRFDANEVGFGSRDDTDVRSGFGRLLIDVRAELQGNVITVDEANYWTDSQPAGTTTSATYVNMPGSPSTQIYKMYDETLIRVDMHVGFFLTGAQASSYFGLNIAGVSGAGDYDIARMASVTAGIGVGLFCGGTRFLSGLGAGTITATARWRRSTGTGTLNTSTAMPLSFSLREIPEASIP